MSRKVLLLFAVHLSIGSHVAATLTSSPNSTNGAITVCPGVPISITCTHNNNNSGVTRWIVTSTLMGNCAATVSHGAEVSLDAMCVPSELFTITMISGLSSPTMFTSTAQTNATEALNGAVVECFSSGVGSTPLGTVTINVLAVDVTGQLEQQGLSAVIVNADLLESSSSACVDEYFAVISGTRLSNATTKIGPFSMDLCSSPEVRDVTVGTSKNGVDSPTVTATSFSANTSYLYSNLVATHMFNVSRVILYLTWNVVDQQVMAKSDVSCSCLSSTVLSDSPTSHILELTINQLPSPQVNLSISYENDTCIDMESLQYNVENFGTATIPLSASETVLFIFNPRLLADGVSVTSIRGMCQVDGSQLISWDYQQRFSINFTSTCVSGPYVFQAFDGMNRSIGFPFTIQVESPTNTVPGIDAFVIGAAVGGSCAVLLVVSILIVLIVLLYCYCLKRDNPHCKDAENDKLTSTNSGQPPTDSLYADPNSIEHEAAPGTEDQYAMVDRKVKKNTQPKPTPPEALYQDPNTIEHETAASGDTYAVVDKPKRSSKKKGGPDVVPPASEGPLTYAEIDLSSKRPKPGSGRQAPQQPGEYPKEHPVEYSSVDHGNTSQL